jgi:4-hydroxybenzoate polyprenyltransferase
MLFFTFPLNLFIYGINDIADNDTDKYNTKKLGYEEALNDTMHDSVKKNILFFTIVSIVCLSFLISQI